MAKIKAKIAKPDRVACLERATDMGWLSMAFSDQGVRAISISDAPDHDWLNLKALLKVDAADPATSELFLSAANRPQNPGKAWLEKAATLLADGPQHTGEDVPLKPTGSSLELAVWKAICDIPRGLTWTYKHLAEVAGYPQAIRAVASACGRNPIALLVPCHRVVRADGGLGGYRWHVARKQKILAMERLTAQ